MGGYAYFEYIVSDNDTAMMKHLIHPDKKPKGREHISGCLPKEILVQKWYVHPTYRVKCIAGAFSELVRSINNMKTLDALKLKRYYLYCTNMNRKQSAKEISKNVMVHLDHIFDDHRLYYSKWCYKKCTEEDTTRSVDETTEKIKSGYYRSKIKRMEMYNELCRKYDLYTT